MKQVNNIRPIVPNMNIEEEYRNFDPEKNRQQLQNMNNTLRNVENIAFGAGRRFPKLVASGLENLATLGSKLSGIEQEYQGYLDPALNVAYKGMGLDNQNLVTGYDEKSQKLGGNIFDTALAMTAGGAVNSAIPLNQVGKARTLWQTAQMEALKGTPYAMARQAINFADTGKFNPQEAVGEAMFDMGVGAVANKAGPLINKGRKWFKNVGEKGHINFDTDVNLTPRQGELLDRLDNAVTKVYGGKEQDIKAQLSDDGYFTLLSDKIKMSIKEGDDAIEIPGFYRGDKAAKGEPTKILEEIKEYAKENGKPIKATHIIGDDVSYWKKVGFKADEIKKDVYEATWSPNLSKGTDVAEQVGKNVDDLVSEAKKYKSAEEFIQAQEYRPLYHQTSPEIAQKIESGGFTLGRGKSGAGDVLPMGINTKSTNAEIQIANKGSQVETFVPKDAKIAYYDNRSSLEGALEWQNPEYSSIKQQMRQVDFKRGKELDVLEKKAYGGELERDSLEYKKLDKQMDTLLDDWHKEINELGDKAASIATEHMKKQGWQGVELKEDIGGVFGNRKTDNIIIFDPKLLKTKSQLTDIWNKANKLKKGIK